MYNQPAIFPQIEYELKENEHLMLIKVPLKWLFIFVEQ